MLKSGGRFFLYNVVYSETNVETNISEWISQVGKVGGLEALEELEGHVREEYSTFTWILESLLEKTVFKIDRVEYDQGVLAKYVCTKVAYS